MDYRDMFGDPMNIKRKITETSEANLIKEPSSNINTFFKEH